MRAPDRCAKYRCDGRPVVWWLNGRTFFGYCRSHSPSVEVLRCGVGPLDSDEVVCLQVLSS